MKTLIILIGIILIVYVIKRFRKIYLVVHHVPIFDQKVVGYKKKIRVMNDSEAALFFELKKQFSEKYYIFPNMRVADVVYATYGPDFIKRKNKILPRHLDFVICDLSFVPALAIELNGPYHNRPDVIEKDKQKKQILEEANLPFVTIKVGDDFPRAVLAAKSLL